VHRVILRWFADHGQPPDVTALEDRTPTGCDRERLLAELHDRDVVRLNAGGGIRAAYPFSSVPTRHRVAISGGPEVYAMCAIDALGMADMLGRGVTVTSTDPVTDERIHVDVDPGRAVWAPDTTVVYVGANQPAGDGHNVAAAADRCCTVMNFFARPDTTQEWITTHPQVSGAVLTRSQALRLGVDIFGRLLDE
jgi:hypothetical protein